MVLVCHRQDSSTLVSSHSSSRTLLHQNTVDVNMSVLDTVTAFAFYQAEKKNETLCEKKHNNLGI